MCLKIFSWRLVLYGPHGHGGYCLSNAEKCQRQAWAVVVVVAIETHDVTALIQLGAVTWQTRVLALIVRLAQTALAGPLEISGKG